MKLSDYLKQNNISQKQFAEKINAHRSLIAHLIAGRKTPSLRMAIKISSATNGAVSVQELVPQ